MISSILWTEVQAQEIVFNAAFFDHSHFQCANLEVCDFRCAGGGRVKSLGVLALMTERVPTQSFFPL